MRSPRVAAQPPYLRPSRLRSRCATLIRMPHRSCGKEAVLAPSLQPEANRAPRGSAPATGRRSVRHCSHWVGYFNRTPAAAAPRNSPQRPVTTTYGEHLCWSARQSAYRNTQEATAAHARSVDLRLLRKTVGNGRMIRPGIDARPTTRQASDLLKHRDMCGAKGTRTPGLLHAMQALYQLSYSPSAVTSGPPTAPRQ